MVRPLIDRFLLALARLVLRGFFRAVEVAGRDRLPSGRPVLVVANHFNGLIDPVIVVHVIGRLPRFLAKASLWRSRAARPFLALAGMIPVHRPEDGPAETAATRSFSSTTDVLCQGRTVAIFPEGTTHDDPQLARIRTGAARIALRARAGGAEGLVIVPVGMAFDDKVGVRTRVFAEVGEPIDMDRDLAGITGRADTDDTDVEAVKALTAEIDARLRAVSPDYADRREAKVLARAAEFACRTTSKRPEVPLADTERLAQRLAYAPAEHRSELMDAVARYQLDLDLEGLRDDQVVPGYSRRQLLGGFVRTALLVAALAVVWVPGLVANTVPYQLTTLAARLVRNPTMKGTARVLSALVVFPLTWALLGWALGVRGWLAWVVFLVAMPMAGIVAVRVLELIVRGWRTWRGWVALVERRALLDAIIADRDRLIARVQATLAAVDDDAPRREVGP